MSKYIAAECPRGVVDELISYERADQNDLGKVSHQLANEVKQIEQNFVNRVADLRAQHAETDDPLVKMDLEQEIRELEQSMADLRDVSERSRLQGSSSYESSVRTVAEEFRNQIRDSYVNFGTWDSPASDPAGSLSINRPALMDRLDVDDLRRVSGGIMDRVWNGGEEQVRTNNETDAKAEGANEETKSIGEMSENMNEMVNLLATDPDAFMEELSDLEPEERNTMMMTVQTQLQQMNQLFQMTSQFSQAMHDTQSAIIQNMRV